MYGQTEATARLSYLPPDFWKRKWAQSERDSRSSPQSPERVRRRAAPGEIGEIVAEGENVTKGYWDAPQETAETFRDGALHTGDLATTDSDGFIYIVDRKKNFLKCGGKRVGIQEIENRLMEFPCITEGVACGDA